MGVDSPVLTTPRISPTKEEIRGDTAPGPVDYTLPLKRHPGNLPGGEGDGHGPEAFHGHGGSLLLPMPNL